MVDLAGGRNILDDAAAMARADTEDMLGHVYGLADQVADGWRRSRELELPWSQPSAVAVLGVGGSATGADLVKSAFADRISVPFEVLRGYDLPAWVGPDTLVIASSRGGDTEETLRQLETALARRCPVVAVTGGGALRRVAEAAGLPLAVMPEGGPTRAAVGWSVAVIAGILERTGTLDIDDAEIETSVAAAREAVARFEPAVPTADNPAKQLAWSLVDRYVVVAASDYLAPVARHWKAQLNLHSKTAAAVEELPEATHSTVVGFEQPESLRDHLAVVFLAGEQTHARNRLQAQLFGDLLETGQIWHTFVEARGGGRLGQVLGALAEGDYVSLYLAFMYAIDPSSAGVVAHIREQLELADQTAEA